MMHTKVVSGLALTAISAVLATEHQHKVTIHNLCSTKQYGSIKATYDPWKITVLLPADGSSWSATLPLTDRDTSASSSHHVLSFPK